MTEIQLSLLNFPHLEILSTILSDFSNDFEFTANGVFRMINPPPCPDCGSSMIHNGFNTYRKGHLGKANVGRYLCGTCGKSVEEDRAFWDKLKTGFFSTLAEVCLCLRLNHASYELIEEIMSYLYPPTFQCSIGYRAFISFYRKRGTLPLGMKKIFCLLVVLLFF